MQILYLTQWFEPEPNIVKGIAFVKALEAAGHRVTVVTGLPNYPAGRLYPGYRWRWFQQEVIDGVRVVRLPLYPSHDRSSFRRSLNYLSFFLSALIYCLCRAGRYDLAYVYHPPITVGLAAALAGRVRRLPFVLDVQDLWPDTIAATGMAGAAWLGGPLGRLCAFVYRRAARIVVQSAGMRRALAGRDVPPGKVALIRNWADLPPSLPAPRPRPADAPFTIVYGGNLGRAQGLETVVQAARLIARERDDVRLVLYGDGVEADALRADAAGLPGVSFPGRVPQDAIIQHFRDADALLIHLRDDPLFEITIPSKTQFYLAMGRPIIAGLAGEAADLLAASRAAMLAPPGDPAALARACLTLAAMSPMERQAMGQAGARYYAENLSFGRGLARTLALMAGINGAVTSNNPAVAP